MQDRFKFRMFNKDVKEMAYFDNLELQVDLENNFKSGVIFPISKGSIYMGNYTIPMQCTGFWDCKSKLLYENDLIEINKRKDCIYKIYWDEDCGQFNAISIHNKNYDFLLAHLFQDFGGNNIKCIGNIYQNPELLKGGEE